MAGGAANSGTTCARGRIPEVGRRQPGQHRVLWAARRRILRSEDCPQCTDTIIVFTVDPVSKTAGMISVPRDMYVNIPGLYGCSGTNDGFCRINTAWTTGEALKLPGGGPG